MMKNARPDPKVSIILPVYNTKNDLDRCLESVLGQTYSNLEIICIDDGSTDGSERILDHYARRDKRIKTIHQKNGGESKARNVGLKLMTGQYVGFLDCDDWIEPIMYERLVETILREGTDVVASSWYYEDGAESRKAENQLPVMEGTFGRKELLNYLYKRDYYRGFAYMWNKLYCRNLFYDKAGNLICFDEDLVLGADVLYLAKLALSTHSAFYIDEAFYHYNQRLDSGCHTQDLRRREDWLEAYRRTIDYMSVNGVETETIVWIKRFLVYHSSNVAEIACKQNNQEVLIRCQKIMQQYEKEYKETNQQYPDRIERYNRILNYRF